MKPRVRPLLAGVIAAVSLVSVYLLLVVLATPTILPDLALQLAISRNWPYLGALAAASGLQAYLVVYSRSLPCRLQKANTVGASSSVVASFTSFFGLTAVGCCGLLPLWIAIAFGGGAVGIGAANFLVEYSTPLTVLGLSVMGASIAFTIRSIRSSLKSSNGNALPEEAVS